MLPEYQSKTPRIITSRLSLDEQIQQEQEQRLLLESMPDISNPKVSYRARLAAEQRNFLNKQRVAHYRIRDAETLASKRPGHVIHANDFLRKLNTLPGRRFSCNQWSARGMRGLRVSRGGGPPVYVCAVQDGPQPPWDLVQFDQYGMVKRIAQRGWHTPLEFLLMGKYITEAEILKLFGFAHGIHGRIFRRNLWELRNRKAADGEDRRMRSRTTRREMWYQDKGV